MSQSALEDALRFIRHACALQAPCDRTDRELLDRFIIHRDENAFTFLLHRHGPMVLSVCRRLLGNSADSEDAFQATFLVFVRGLKSIRGKEAVGSWLFHVARRIALKARAKKNARLKREREAGNMPGREPIDGISCQELRTFLDEEIGSLPEKYRAPIISCYLEGKSYDQAVQELGCPKTSLARRLTKGKDLLRGKLERRGITLAVGALATSLTEMASASPLPAILTIKTVKAATFLAAGKAVAQVGASAGALALMEEALAGMFWVKGKMVLMVMALGLAVGGASWAGIGGKGEKGQAILVGKEPPPEAKDQGSEIGKKDLTVIMDQHGDPLPNGAVARLGSMRFRHEGLVKALVFTSDGNTLVGYTNSGIHVWDTVSGRERLRLPVFLPLGSWGMDISPDGTTLAISEISSLNDDATVILWDLKSAKKTRTLLLPNREGKGTQFNDLRFAPDGKSLALNYHHTYKVAIVDLASGQVGASFGHKGFRFSKPTFSPDCKTLAVFVVQNDSNDPMPSVGPTVQLWDIATQKMIRAFGDFPSKCIQNYLNAITFSPDGKMLAFGNFQRIFVIDPATGIELKQLDAKKTGQIKALAFTNDNKHLVAGIDGQVLIWDVATGRIQRTLTSGDSFDSMAFSCDSKTFALGMSWGNSIQVWDLASGKELSPKYEGHDSQVNGLAFSPDGRTLVSSEEFGHIFLWDTATRQRREILARNARTLSFSPDGQQLATVAPDEDFYKTGYTSLTPKVRIWNLAVGKESAVLSVPDKGNIQSAIFSPDGRKLFTLDRNNEKESIRHWDLATGMQSQMWSIPPPNSNVLTFAPNGKTVFAATQGGGISIHDLDSGRERLIRYQEQQWRNLTLSPDSRVLASGVRGPKKAVRLWEIVTGKEIFALNGHEGTVAVIAWSPDGRIVASADERSDPLLPAVDQTIRVWDTFFGKELVSFSGFKLDVWALTFSPDGKLLVAGMRDGTILIFDMDKPSFKSMGCPKLDYSDLNSLWTDLIGDKTGKAHQAIGTLVSASKKSVPFLQDRLKPFPLANKAEVQQWITDLDNVKFPVRQTAAKKLEKVGEQIIPTIQKVLKDNITLETRRRLEQILKNISDTPGPETLRTIRAIMALERIGSPEAQAVLETLASGAPGARETEEAKASLERLKHRTAIAP